MDEPAPTVVVVGASAGGVEALTEVVGGLPPELNAAVCVVLHLHPGAESRLARILSRAGPLPAVQAHGKEHLVVCAGRVLAVRGPHENGVRPSIDVLFRSAAVTYGRRTVAVVLSGARDDGVAGASAVGSGGGGVFVQDPQEALFASMPAETISRDHPDRVLPRDELAAAVAETVQRRSEEDPMRENAKGEMSLETGYATLDRDAIERDGPPGQSSAYARPECGGVLWETGDDPHLRFRCRVGHAYAADGALEAQGESVEQALWTALRALQERAQLSERLANRVGEKGAEQSRARFQALADEAREQAETIRRVLGGSGSYG